MKSNKYAMFQQLYPDKKIRTFKAAQKHSSKTKSTQNLLAKKLPKPKTTHENPKIK
jgi:hypothetical protein